MKQAIYGAIFGLLMQTMPTLAGEAQTDWSQWRGPQRDAHVAGELGNLSTLHEIWSIDVGGGQASPVLGPGPSGTRVYVHSRWQDRESVAAFDLETAKLAWRQSFDEPYDPYPGAKSFGKGPKSTPALHDGILCTLSVTGTAGCFEAKSGKVLWRKSYGEQFPEPYPPFGTAMSPLIDDGRLIVHVGGHPAGALLALDPETGREIWRYDGEGPGYSSPVVATFDGSRQIITHAHRNIVAVDAETGRPLWKHASVTPCDQNIVTPLQHAESLIFSSLDHGIFALRPRRNQEGTWQAEMIWHNKDWSLFMSSPVLVGDSLVGFAKRRRGQLFALDAATGEERWVGEPGQGSHAALIGLDDGLVALTIGGDLVRFKASDKGFERGGTLSVAADDAWTHPVPVGDGWLIKNGDSLRRLAHRAEPREDAVTSR